MRSIFAIFFIIYIFCSIVEAQEEFSKSRLAIPKFETRGEAKQDLGESLADLLASELKISRYFQIIERSRLKTIVDERTLTLDKIFSSEEAYKISQNLQADFVLLGAIEKHNGKWIGHYRLVEIKSAKIQDGCTGVVEDAKDYHDLSSKIRNKIQNEFVDLTGLSKIARTLAKSMAKDLTNFAPKSNQWNVVVFPFGNLHNQAPATFGNLPLIMQNELIRYLQEFLPENLPISVLTPFQIQEKLKSKKIDFTKISLKKLGEAKQILQDNSIEIGILGQFDGNVSGYLPKTWTSVKAYLIFSNLDKVYRYEDTIHYQELKRLTNIIPDTKATRFGLEFWVKINEKLPDSEPSSWKKIELQRCKSPSSNWYNVRFLLLESHYLGKRYKIRLNNYGLPKLQNHPLDKDRLFAVTLSIDGVNTIYHKASTMRKGEKSDSYIPVIVHPNKANKWVLSAPNRALVNSPEGMLRTCLIAKESTKIEGMKLVDAEGIGNSQLEILGFQTGMKESSLFTFAKAKDSIAETVGLTSQVGLISAYFYPEILPLIDEAVPAATSAGAEISHQVTKLQFQREQIPIESIHVVYRYRDEFPCALEELELIQND